jgi:hypothetical protein
MRGFKMRKITKNDISNSNYTTRKIKDLFAPTSWILEGEEIDSMMDQCESQGYIALDYEDRNQRQFVSIRNTYMLRCKESGRVYIEALIKDDKIFALFDCITTLNNEFPFKKWMILEKELENYYRQFDFVSKAKLNLPSKLDPFTHIYHKTNFFITSKQIVFSFYHREREIFDFLRSSMLSPRAFTYIN